MSNMLKYKGFYGSIEFSIEDMVLYGKIECINDLVTYEAADLPGLKSAFEEAVDDYVETCAIVGKAPEKPMSGSFNIRIGEDLHKKAYLAAKDAGISLNEIVKNSIEEKLVGKKEFHFHIERRSEESRDAFGYVKRSSESAKWVGTVEKGTHH
ncbi:MULTISPECIES: type II toxin-antitoxin system HicB family antitoxin [Yersinia]|uniref:type II toxin-antitoxin system HicB family antitoxin n=1 Tax=Yersinia TaxID=629 RepID=UPI0011A494DB|nr:type II toxin-antitoxin system HicB family antitoxin [Yersinia canariae]EKN4037610.1 type II toxin-antitoxin system HicB family antitoxin [Yersinia enterocolitica]EKN5124999.1 type II toxin-antitoxin system HicB family antitoxin [Yersinia enterocolitica]EKN5130168.1 type II toxin-antitoxin system HicB family antitoxin [Yersinia enterocolitica]EKN6195691.1 type II toxin-antitoxin system HicB family antitoxin [Yersinia enterocolitica]ELI7980703.1 type II toxin-antitoxin system HicB family ant